MELVSDSVSLCFVLVPSRTCLLAHPARRASAHLPRLCSLAAPLPTCQASARSPCLCPLAAPLPARRVFCLRLLARMPFARRLSSSRSPALCFRLLRVSYLNTTGGTFRYGPGRKVSETRHTVLGRHTETGQPTLGSGRPTLQHQRTPGQVPAQTGKAQVLPQRKTTLMVIIGRTSNRKETGTQGVASLGRGIGAGLFPEARPRGTTPRVGNRCIAVSSQTAWRPEAIPLHPVVRRHEGSCYHSHPCH
jgi:hypothetical protein